MSEEKSQDTLIVEGAADKGREAGVGIKSGYNNNSEQRFDKARVCLWSKQRDNSEFILFKGELH